MPLVSKVHIFRKAILLPLYLFFICSSFQAEAQRAGDIIIEGESAYAVGEEEDGLALSAHFGYAVTSLIAIKAGYSHIELSTDDQSIDYSIDKFSAFGEFVGYFSKQFGVGGLIGGSIMGFENYTEHPQTGIGLDIGTKLHYMPTSRFAISLKLNNNFNTENNYIITAGLSLQYRFR